MGGGGGGDVHTWILCRRNWIFFWGGVGLSIHKKSPDGSPSRRYKRMHLGFGAHNFMAVEYKKGNNSQEHTCTVHVRVMTWSPCSARSSSPC